MFDRDHVEEILDLQRRSYALLRWIDAKVQDGTLPIGSLHGALDASIAAVEWLSRNAASIPTSARPPEGKLEKFAHLFASYLVTSFEIAAKKKVRAACGCELCSYLVAVPNLKVRAPSAPDERIAEEVKLDCLEALALEEGAALFRTELGTFVGANADLNRPIAIVAYVRELDRRSTYRGQGRPVLALWRQFAWQDGRPTRNFELTADEVLHAQEAIRERLRQVTS